MNTTPQAELTTTETSSKYALMLARLALAIAVLTLVGIGYQINGMRQEDARAAQTWSEINARAARPATRHTSVNADGISEFTLCTGSGWCTTDRVPPDEPTVLQQSNKGSALSVFDEAAVREQLKR
ncbi:MAG: hypothetical protein EOP14_00495 [Pseudomonas sp.]|nr:MAG: hypothetical protein EOP14_00495 [Pseudomonas sp.]